MLKLTQFNQQFTVRKLEQFGTPKVAPLERLEFPRGTVLHYLDFEATTIAPPLSLDYLQNIKTTVQCRHHGKLPEEVQGLPKPIKINHDKAILQHHRLNKRLMRTTTTKVVEKNDKIMLIENYNPIVSRYYYNDVKLSWYHRIHNLIRSVVVQLKEDTELLERQNYVILDIGKELPSFTKLKLAQDKRTEQTLSEIRTPTQLWVLELFTWLGEERASSILNGLEEYQMLRTNFIITYENGFINLNLGELESWRKADKKKGDVTAVQMQRRLYRSLKALMTTPLVIDTENTVSPDGSTVRADQNMQFEDLDSQKDREEIIAELDRYEAEETLEEDEGVKIIDTEVTPSNVYVMPDVVPLNEYIERETATLEKAGRLSTKAKEFLNKSANNWVELPDPYGSGKSYLEAMEVTEADQHVEVKHLLDSPAILETSWTENMTDGMHEKYRDVVMQKDILSAVAGAQRVGMVIHDHKIERRLDATGHVENHRIKVQMPDGDPTTVNFTVPVLDEDGYWTSNGVKYTMRQQRVDVPIRKVKPDTVALTTFYGKNFVRLSDKVVNNREKWLGNLVTKVARDLKDTRITKVQFDNVFTQDVRLPKDYGHVARHAKGFHGGGYVWNFDYSAIGDVWDDKAVEALTEHDLVPVAKGRKVNLGMALDGTIYSLEGTELTDLGKLADVLGLDSSKEPRELTEVSMMGKAIPLGLVMAYYKGLEGMLKELSIRYEVVGANDRTGNVEGGTVIRLADAKYIIYPATIEQRYLVNGLYKYHKVFPRFTRSECERTDIYLNILQEDGMTARYITELDRMRFGFVDSVHERILKKMGEPTNFEGLLLRSNEMLIHSQSKPEINGDEMMTLGHQRIAGHVYTGLMRAVRNYANQPASGRKLELTNSMVWGEISSDPSVLVAQDANPIQSIKQSDVVTMGGTGGRSKQTMVKRTRAYHKTDLGITSGDTVDNSDVSITAFNSANPQIETIDGLPKADRDPSKLEVSKLMSFCTGLVPDSLYDDDKRYNFVNIQLGSTTTAEGYTVSPYRTGVEMVAAHRTSNKHAQVTRTGGKVVEVTDDEIVVKDPDGGLKSYPLGRWYGQHEGVTYPHDVVTRWKKGDKLEANTVVTYNGKHFEPDLMDPKQVNWLNGCMGTVVLIEGEPTFEDSTIIDQTIAYDLRSETTKVKEVVVKFDQVIQESVKAGTKVSVDTILCTFADDVVGGDGVFSEDVASTLRRLSSWSPPAGEKGQVDKIEVVYHGEYEDMSPTVLELVKKSDGLRRKEAKASNGTKPKDGSVGDNYRVDGIPLGYNEIAIKFYISTMRSMAGGDKMVVGNQMKTTAKGVMSGKNETLSGVPVNLYFARSGIEGRIVGSFYRIGTTNAVAEIATARQLKILKGENVPAF